MTGITIARDSGDRIATTAPVGWATTRLANELDRSGITVRIVERPDPTAPGATILVAGADAATAQSRYAGLGVPGPSGPESFALLPSADDTEQVTLVCGADMRGLVYAVLELAERVEQGRDPLAVLPPAPLVEQPANKVRSVMRLFCSELEDMTWFHDEVFWQDYLSMLVAQRFNRFSLTLGLGYNYQLGVTDGYFYFAYPFLLSVPGHDVRVPQLPDEERDRNVAMLRYISEQAVGRGLDFQLGLWTHAFEWIDSPEARHTIEGLTAERHAEYCRDAVTNLLEECPAIGGLTFRIHGESGVPESSWKFWLTMFTGVAASGRTVGIDLHAKGLDDVTLRYALDTGLPVTVSPKFWAEHMGLPYHQAAIRELERPVREDPSDLSEWHRYMAVSEGSRPFTRYGYADFLREDRPYDVVFRLWPGTQRLLLWGDPECAAAYGRAGSFAGCQGIEWFEPLSFKGRQGSGVEGSRTGYADPSLVPANDWSKFAYAYRLFGRLSYDPDAPPEVWRGHLERSFGEKAREAEAALARASRILPLVTTAHHPSASNNYFWPELYTDMPIVWSDDGTRAHPYLDTPIPRRFGTVAPLDPEVFSSIAEFVRELMAGEPTGRVSPLQVASCLDRFAEEAAARIDSVASGSARDHEARRWIADVRITAALGRFFAGKLRAGLYYELHSATGDREALGRAIEVYRAARAGWREAATIATGVYADDLTFGPEARLRGHWADRLPAIEADLDAMEGLWNAGAESGAAAQVAGRILESVSRSMPPVELHHTPPPAFRADEPLELRVRPRGETAAWVRGMALRFRPMNHALTYSERAMVRVGDEFIGRVAAEELESNYGLAYAFVLRDSGATAVRYPGLGADLMSQPYFTVRPMSGSQP